MAVASGAPMKIGQRTAEPLGLLEQQDRRVRLEIHPNRTEPYLDHAPNLLAGTRSRVGAPRAPAAARRRSSRRGHPLSRSPQRRAQQRAPELLPQPGQVVGRLGGPGAGLGIALADHGDDDLFDEARLALGGVLVEAQVAGLDAEGGEAWRPRWPRSAPPRRRTRPRRRAWPGAARTPGARRRTRRRSPLAAHSSSRERLAPPIPPGRGGRGPRRGIGRGRLLRPARRTRRRRPVGTVAVAAGGSSGDAAAAGSRAAAGAAGPDDAVGAGGVAAGWRSRCRSRCPGRLRRGRAGSGGRPGVTAPRARRRVRRWVHDPASPASRRRPARSPTSTRADPPAPARRRVPSSGTCAAASRTPGRRRRRPPSGRRRTARRRPPARLGRGLGRPGRPPRGGP